MTARMVDGGNDIDVGRLMGELPAVVLVTHMDAPTFEVLPHPDPVLLRLRADEMPDAVRWPNLAGVEVRAVTDGMVPSVAARLVTLLLEAGADVVHEFDVANKVPHCVRTHTGGRR